MCEDMPDTDSFAPGRVANDTNEMPTKTHVWCDLVEPALREMGLPFRREHLQLIGWDGASRDFELGDLMLWGPEKSR